MFPLTGCSAGNEKRGRLFLPSFFEKSVLLDCFSFILNIGEVYMIYKNCPRCKKLMPYGKTYCESCSAIIAAERKKRKAENDRRYNQRRDAKYKKFYNSDPWKSLSEARLSRDKHCSFCGEPAQEVDHIIEIQTPEGWARRLDWNNTRSVCTVCHNIRHNRFLSRKKRKSAAHGGG